MPDLKSYKVISLEASEWDKKVSVPETGEFLFTRKVFVDQNLYRTEHRPRFVFKWNRNHAYDITDWQNKWPGCTFVTAKDGYVVDRLKPNADGHFVYKDAVLMKIPIEEYVEQRRKEIKVSETSAVTAQRAFREEAGSMGIDLSLDDIKKAFGLK